MQAYRLQVSYRAIQVKPAKNHPVNVLSEIAGYFFLDLALTCGRMEAEEVLHGGKLRSHGFPESSAKNDHTKRHFCHQT